MRCARGVKPAPANGGGASRDRQLHRGDDVDRPEVVGAVDAAAPTTQADLDAKADRMTPTNCGVRPVVRVLEDATLPAYFDSGEATCEELHEDGWRR